MMLAVQLRLVNEQILDLGCGRGAVLLLAAQRLTTGKAVGVDLWRTADQSGNSAEATRRNAEAEGVADRVDAGNVGLGVLRNFVATFDLANASLYLARGVFFQGAVARDRIQFDLGQVQAMNKLRI